MSVVSIASRRRRSGEDELRSRIRRLEAELESLQKESGGSLVTLAKLLELGREGLNWENLARVSRALYFSWHSEEVDEFGYDERYAESIQPVLEFLYALWWRVESQGVENIPAKGPALIVANHSGVLPWDGLMIQLAVRQEHPARRRCRLLALDMFALFPFLAPALARIGAVRASQENGERLLEGGELVGVFPEGVKGIGKHFKNRYKLARFGRGGYVRLALRTGAPIIPCAVVGAEEIYPVLARADFVGRPLGLPYVPITPTFPLLGLLGTVPLPTKWTLEFGDPVPTKAYGAASADDPIFVNSLSEKVRSTIQRMLDGRVKRRRSVFFG